MTTARSDRLRPLLRPAAVVTGALVLLYGVHRFAEHLVDLALRKRFSIDEMQYAHAAWLVSRGDVPYRDFFEVHLPFLYQALSPVFLVGDGTPVEVLDMRRGMIVIAAIAAVAAWRVVAVHGRVVALVAPVILFANVCWARWATEIRPDALASTLLLAALAALAWRSGPPAVRGALAGALFVLACWSSQKVFYYGVVFVGAFVHDVWARACGDRRALLGDPIAFAIGVVAALAPITLHLLLTGSLDDLLQWCFVWAAAHQTEYSSYAFMPYLIEALHDIWWIVGLAVVGYVHVVQRLLRGADPAARADPDWLLVGVLPTSFLSMAVQQAPYPYSYTPFLLFLSVFAGRGVGAAIQGFAATTAPRAFLGVVVAMSLTYVLVRAEHRYAVLLKVDNASQLEVLRTVDRLTAPTDVAYDNSGSYVARRHAHFHFYTDLLVRIRDAQMLAAEVPAALARTQTALVFRDVRLGGVPPQVRKYIEAHYAPYSGDLLLPGHKLAPGHATVDVVKAGTWFVEPLSAAAAVKIDGAPVGEDGEVELTSGAHAVEVPASMKDVHLLWLPRDGRRWQPRYRDKPTFSQLL